MTKNFCGPCRDAGNSCCATVQFDLRVRQINMTNTCAVNKPPASGDFGGLPIGGGGIRY
jgi:hypothetical protein